MAETPERPMAPKYEFLEDGAVCRLSTEGPKKFTVSMPAEFDDNLREGALAGELLHVVAERDEARARIVALETENAELRKDLGRAERAIQSEGEQAFDAGLSEGWSLHKEVSSGR